MFPNKFKFKIARKLTIREHFIPCKSLNIKYKPIVEYFGFIKTPVYEKISPSDEGAVMESPRWGDLAILGANIETGSLKWP